MRGMSEQPLPDLGRLAGIVTARELADFGVARAAIRSMVSRGTLMPLRRATYARTDLASKVLDRPGGNRALRIAAALAAAGPGVVASHHDAAHMYRLDLLEPPPDAVSLTMPPALTARRSARPGINLHYASLPPSHIALRDKVPVTTVPRTVLDLGRTLPFRAGVVTADSALFRGWTTKADLLSAIDAMAHWPGVDRARQVVDFADAKAESPFESIARVAFYDWGLPAPELQVVVGADGEVIARVDFYWRQHATIAEADGALKYANPDRARQQLERDARLRTAGFEVVHFTWRDLHTNPNMVMWRIIAAFHRQAVLGRGRVR